MQPFLPTLFNYNTTPSAYPPDRTCGFFPLEIYFGWKSADDGQAIYDAVRTSAQRLEAKAIADGLSDANAVVYPNFAIFDTPLVKLYGANVQRLQAVKRAVDPDNVMGLAGGFKLRVHLRNNVYSVLDAYHIDPSMPSPPAKKHRSKLGYGNDGSARGVSTRRLHGSVR